MRWLFVAVLTAALACSGGTDRAVIELTLQRESSAGAIDFARVERRLLAVRGVTLVSFNPSREVLTIHHGPDTDVQQIRVALRDSGFRLAASD